MINLWDQALYCSVVLFFFGALVLCFTKFCYSSCYDCYQRRGLVQDIETGRIPSTRTPTRIDVFHHFVVGLEQPNRDRQTLAELIANHGQIVQEQIYDSSTCKNDDCVICLEEFKKDEKIGFLVSCQHSFHGQCVNKWLRVNRSCPICREPIKS